MQILSGNWKSKRFICTAFGETERKFDSVLSDIDQMKLRFVREIATIFLSEFKLKIAADFYHAPIRMQMIIRLN